jgi:hypothetical protein
MNQYKQAYNQMFHHLDQNNQNHFKALEKELDAHFSDDKEKWSILHDMMHQFYKSRGKTFQSLFGDDPIKHAFKVKNSVRKNGVNYWKSVALMNIYFVFFFVLVIIITGEITVSSLLLLPLVLSLIMIPLLNHGITDRSVKKSMGQNINTALFAIIFTLSQGIILFSFHPILDAFSIVHMETSVLNMFSTVAFSLATLASLVFIVTSNDVYNKILFSVVGLYTFSWVCNQLNIWPSFTHFMLTYGMFILLPVVLVLQLIRGKRHKE